MTALTRELERTRNGAKVMERTLEAAALRIKELEQIVRLVVNDELMPDDLIRAAALLEKS